MAKDFLKEMFINEAKPALDRHSGSGVVDVQIVDELPTQNIRQGVLYKVKSKIVDLNVYVKTGSSMAMPLNKCIENMGLTPNLTYYLVDSLPENPNVSDLQTFNPAYVYICDDVSYTYGNIGYGNMWITVSDLVYNVTQIKHLNAGHILLEILMSRTESEMPYDTIFVTYKHTIEKYCFYNNKWIYLYDENQGAQNFVDGNIEKLEIILPLNDNNTCNINPYQFAHLPNTKILKLKCSLGPLMNIEENGISNNIHLEVIDFTINKFTLVNADNDHVIQNTICSGGFRKNPSLKKIIIRSEHPTFRLDIRDFTGCYHFTGEYHPIFNPDSSKDGVIYVNDDLVEYYENEFGSEIKGLGGFFKPLSELEE